MKTAEEILKTELYGDFLKSIPDSFQKSRIIKAMKLYANHKLDEAAEKASVDLHYRHGENILWNASVNKKSILSLKDAI